MKIKLKRIVLILLLFITITSGIQLLANQDNVTDIGLARYYVDEVRSENDLPNGVKHYTHKGMTSAIQGEVTDMGMNVTEPFVPNKYYSQQVNILEVPSSKDVIITPWAYISNSEWSLKTVRDIARDYESHHPGYKVIAAINGDFFDIQGSNMYPYTPNHPHASNGENYKSVSGTTAIGFLNDGSTEPLIGNEKLTRASHPTLAIYDENDNIIKQFTINKVNEEPRENEIAVFYPKFGVAYHNARPKVVPINIDNAYIIDDGEYSIPFSSVKAVYGNVSDNEDFYGKGIITCFGSGELSANDFAIKSNNEEVSNALQIGVKIRVQYEFTGVFAGVKDVIGYNKTILYDGEKVDINTQRAPRTMVGVRADGTIIMAVVDGRQPEKGMYGAAQAEMAAILKHYGAIEGYNLDGGGSSTMIILDDEDFKVTNSPSDGKERTDANALLVVIKIPILEHQGSNITSSSLTIDINVINDHGYDCNKLYVKLNDEMKQIVDDKVTFNNLTFNRNYNYEFYYQKDGEYIRLYIFGKIKTAKRSPTIDHCLIYYEGDNLVFNVNYHDPDNVIVRGAVKIGDEEKQIIQRNAIFYNFKSKSLLNQKITLIVDTANGLGETEIVFDEYKVRCGTTILMRISNDQFLKMLKGFYQE